MDTIIIIIVGLPLVALATIVVANIFKKKKVANIAECIFWWTTVSIVFPFRAKSLGLIHKKMYSSLLIFISPVAIFTYLVIYVIATEDKPLPYDELSFTSHEEIVAITEMPDFPEFEYIDNSRSNWYDITWTRNKFKNEDDSKLLIEKIEKKLSDKENYFWTKNAVHESEKEYFGGDEVYVLSRGWMDTSYMELPKGIMESWVQVEIAISEKMFVIKKEDCYPWDVDYYLNPDSLSMFTGVRFPDYKIVNCRYSGGLDPGWYGVLELERLPSKTFIQSISKSQEWEKLDDGSYKFFSKDRDESDRCTSVYVDPKSKFVEFSVWYY